MPVETLAQFLGTLRRLNLLTHEQREELEQGLQTRFAQPKELARELVQRGWLTPFQANQLFLGREQQLALGSYVLLEKLGEGGMGTVYRARNWKLGRIVALKLIRKEKLTNSQAVQRFQREIRSAAQLDHPNIVRAFDADQVDGANFFVMEYVAGATLADLVKAHGPLPLDQACDFMRQAALGLQHAFERGLVHRDIKPANILVTTTERRATSDRREAVLAGAGSAHSAAPGTGLSSHDTLRRMVKILDMGLARREHDDSDGSTMITIEGSVMGTPDFISPEQSLESHTVDIRSDLYSLGCTFHFAITGRVPFPGGSMAEKLLKHQLRMPERLDQLRPDAPAALGYVVRKLMAKQPEERYQTPLELAHDLDLFQAGRLEEPKATTDTMVEEGAAATPELPRHQPAPLEGFGDFLPALRELRQQREQEQTFLRKLILGSAIGLSIVLMIVLAFLVLPLLRDAPKHDETPAKRSHLESTSWHQPFSG